ncbi:MAG: hypothetical protein M3P40_11575 [Actinomycetota bacterium]|nr:hypothetical protein [Actinomycetota bacterium]
MGQQHFLQQIPDAPPAEVLAEIDAAWERSAAFFDDGSSVHIRRGCISGRVRGELRCEGLVLETLSASQLLALACGDPLPLKRS